MYSGTSVLNIKSQLGKAQLGELTGPAAIVHALKKVNVQKEIPKVEDELKNAPPTNVNKLNTKLKYLKTLDNLQTSPEKAYTMQYLPVVPPIFRPVYPLPSGDIMVNDINQLYRNVGLINNGIKNSKDILVDEDKTKSLTALYKSVSALQGMIEPLEYG